MLGFVTLIGRHGERIEHAWRVVPEIADSPELLERIHFSHDYSKTIHDLTPQVVHFEFGNLALGHLSACREVGAASVVGFRGYDACYQRLNAADRLPELPNRPPAPSKLQSRPRPSPKSLLALRASRSTGHTTHC